MFAYAKALIGGVIAGLSSAEAILQSNNAFTAKDYITAIIAGIVAFAAVARIPNKKTL